MGEPTVKFKLAELLQYLSDQGVDVEVDEAALSKEFTGLASLEDGQAHHVSFLANSKYKAELVRSKAGAVFVSLDDSKYGSTVSMVTKQPYYAYALTSQFVQQRRKDPLHLDQGVVASIQVHDSAQVDASASLGFGVVIGAGCKVGAHAHIGALSVLGRHVIIGDNSVLAPHVVIYDNVHIGRACRIQSQAVIGSDGFGYAPTANGWQPIAQLGGVIIGDNVHVGASTSIDRGAISATVIGNGVIIDNQVQIAHNVSIGEFTAIAGCVGIAGSTKIGAHCTIAGAAGIAGHLELVDHVHIGMQAQVTNSIHKPGRYASGTGLYPLARWRRLVVRLRQLIG